MLKSGRLLVIGVLLGATLIIVGCNVPFPISFFFDIPEILLQEALFSGGETETVFTDPEPVPIPSESELLGEAAAKAAGVVRFDGVRVGEVNLTITAANQGSLDLGFIEALEVLFLAAGESDPQNGTLVATGVVEGGEIKMTPDPSFEILQFIRENDAGTGEPTAVIAVTGTQPTTDVNFGGTIELVLELTLNPFP